MNWITGLILSVGMISSALIIQGNDSAKAEAGDYAAALHMNAPTAFVWHAVSDKVRFCYSPQVDGTDGQVVCTEWR